VAALAAATAVLLLCAQAGAQVRSEGQPEQNGAGASRTAVVFDAVVLRPLGLVATVIGAGLFPAAALVSVPGGRDSVEEAWELFVLVPGKAVFQRPLGEF
jgi:hypothetical protein